MAGESTNCCGGVEWIVCIPDQKAVGTKFSLGPGTSLLSGCLTTESGPLGENAGTLRDITNGDFISLTLSAENVEKCGKVTLPDDSCLSRYFEVLHFWLMKFTTQAFNSRSPTSVQAKCGRVKKVYVKLVSNYNRRPTEKNCSALFDFLCQPFVWKLDVLSKCISEQDGIVAVPEKPAPAAPSTIPAPCAVDVPESDCEIVLRQGKTLFDRDLVSCNIEKELLAYRLDRQLRLNSFLEEKIEELSSFMSKDSKGILKERKLLEKKTLALETKVKFLRDKIKSKTLKQGTVDRKVHEKIVAGLVQKSKVLTKDFNHLSLQFEAGENENEL
ncbi:hypothetical protein V1264_002675 [Littorina saxatilis]|uniref:Uncharacterized protein n=2 Tax=Littorina saxatilis TaxID=31220 RepID=A0AAN9B484_9CAEN